MFLLLFGGCEDFFWKIVLFILGYYYRQRKTGNTFLFLKQVVKIKAEHVRIEGIRGELFDTLPIFGEEFLFSYPEKINLRIRKFCSKLPNEILNKKRKRDLELLQTS